MFEFRVSQNTIVAENDLILIMADKIHTRDYDYIEYKNGYHDLLKEKLTVVVFYSERTSLITNQ